MVEVHSRLLLSSLIVSLSDFLTDWTPKKQIYRFHREFRESQAL